MNYSKCVVLIVLLYVLIIHAFNIEQRIAGGKTAELGQFPYFAYLRIYFPDFSTGFCGASLVNDEWVITAAHCLLGAQSVNIIFGETQLNNPESGHVAVFADKSNFHIHPAYNPETVFNDIGSYADQRYNSFVFFIHLYDLLTC